MNGGSSLCEICLQWTPIYLVLEHTYFARGKCSNVRVHCRGWQVALHIARGLHHMHSRKVMHLDLKSANILLARDGTAKVADVGLAKILTRDNTHVSMEGTFDWAAPEVRLPFQELQKFPSNQGQTALSRLSCATICSVLLQCLISVNLQSVHPAQQVCNIWRAVPWEHWKLSTTISNRQAGFS